MQRTPTTTGRQSEEPQRLSDDATDPLQQMDPFRRLASRGHGPPQQHLTAVASGTTAEQVAYPKQVIGVFFGPGPHSAIGAVWVVAHSDSEFTLQADQMIPLHPLAGHVSPMLAQ